MAVHKLSVTITSGAIDVQAAWPDFTLSHFHLRTQETLKASGADIFAFAPYISNETGRKEWEAYARENQHWLQESFHDMGLDNVDPGPLPDSIHTIDQNKGSNNTLTGHIPLWQMEPPPTNASILLHDLNSFTWFRRLSLDAAASSSAVMSSTVDMSFLSHHGQGNETPHSIVLEPIYGNFRRDDEIDVRDNNPIVGYVLADVPWETYFTQLLPEGTDGYIITVQDTCGASFTYRVNGNDAEYCGTGDLHKPEYDYLKKSYHVSIFDKKQGVTESIFHCAYDIHIYPSDIVRDTYQTSDPIIYAAVVILIFLATTMVFFIYDCAVERRQTKVLATATRTTAVISSLFPKNVKDRILQEAEEQAKQEMHGNKRSIFGAKQMLKDFAWSTEHSEAASGNTIDDTAPIADLFPEATIIFADLVGFTAWSSARQPSEVFTLLETLYRAFDEVARMRRIFKVETVGDCYVAVAGLYVLYAFVVSHCNVSIVFAGDVAHISFKLPNSHRPEARKDHAVVMARFARDCLYKMSCLLPVLEERLGPETSELGLRVGLHSGPVTAGVLRGDKARFQLFGDTVNTTARIETTGAKNCIHVSQETASLLSNAGKGHWLRPREEKVAAKGKGELTTFWLDTKSNASRSYSFTGSENSDSVNVHLRNDLTVQYRKSVEEAASESSRTARLVSWSTDVLTKLLRAIVARREAIGTVPDLEGVLEATEQSILEKGATVLEEVQDVIILPKYNAKARNKVTNPEAIDLGDEVAEQLQNYVQTIAGLYRENPFHNFEHVSHVAMSAVKLLSRINAPDISHNDDDSDLERALHDHTYGITSNPLTQFAVVFSALVHDVDHQGVPNAQLIKENCSIAAVYRKLSVAEQNSVDIAWNLLMQDHFKELRRTIYATSAEFVHFRQVVVNSVMATDIMDKSLGAARKARWEKAFSDEQASEESAVINVNRKSTIVIEHLIQASDVAHTMQHWHIYRKWNARLFEEMCDSYHNGRADKDPAENWYQGEIDFFDFYIIPLAKKLKDCGVFGVSSDEYLNYAMQNRHEWELKGRKIVAEMVESFKKKRAETLCA